MRVRAAGWVSRHLSWGRGCGFGQQSALALGTLPVRHVRPSTALNNGQAVHAAGRAGKECMGSRQLAATCADRAALNTKPFLELISLEVYLALRWSRCLGIGRRISVGVPPVVGGGCQRGGRVFAGRGRRRAAETSRWVRHEARPPAPHPQTTRAVLRPKRQTSSAASPVACGRSTRAA